MPPAGPALGRRRSSLTVLVTSTVLLAALPAQLLAGPARLAGAWPCQSVRVENGVTTFSDCDAPAPADRAAVSRARAGAEAGARAFLDAYAPRLGLGKDSSDLELIQTRRGLRGAHVRFQQRFAGYPIVGAYVSVHQGDEGQIRRVHSSYRATPVTARAMATPTLSWEQAETVGRAAAGVGTPATLRAPSRHQLVWYPRADSRLMLAWELMIYAEQPLGDFLTLVDAQTGELLQQENLIAFFETGRGYVYLPNPVQSSGDRTLQDNNDAAPADPTHPLNRELITVDLLGLTSGSGKLVGEFADLATLNSPDPPYNNPVLYPDADEPSRDYFYARNDPRFEQVVVYHAIDSVQRYIQSLGFNRQKGNGIRDFPTRANAHWYDADNSYYSTGDDALHFGDGGVDDAEDADIIIHEYGHAIQHDQNRCYFVLGGDMVAMGEGFSDYLAASFYADVPQGSAYQAAHAACVGEWDSAGYEPPRACLRRVDSGKRYPDDLTGSVHDRGEIWSAALWDIRQVLGGRTTDQLVLGHHFSVPCRATMPMAAREMIAVDGDLNESVNEPALRQAFCRRGILKGADCQLALRASGDSFLNGAVVNRNEGANPGLWVTENGASFGLKIREHRAVVGFDLSGVDPVRVASAALVMHIAQSSKGWGKSGRTVDAHPLLADFAEGNGKLADIPLAERTAGKGPGVSWKCAVDPLIERAWQNCRTGWNGGLYGLATAAPVRQMNNMSGQVQWDVTADVQAGASAWLIKKTQEDQGGRVKYYSREGAGAAGDMTLAPQLVITFAD